MTFNDGILDEDDPNFLAEIGQYEPADPDEEPHFIKREDVKDIDHYPCLKCGTQMPNEDNFFVCPQCGSMYTDMDIAIDYNEHFAYS